MAEKPETPMTGEPRRCVAFAGSERIAAGSLTDAAAAARRALDRDPGATILVFDRETGEIIDLDLRGSVQDVVARCAATQAPGRDAEPPRRGRPKLGVVAREVTLLPRHWDWLARQPGGASITLRKLVEAAQRSSATAAKARAEATYRFMAAIAGDLPDFEEATRALFANDRGRLAVLTARWPRDIAEEVGVYAGPAASS